MQESNNLRSIKSASGTKTVSLDGLIALIKNKVPSLNIEELINHAEEKYSKDQEGKVHSIMVNTSESNDAYFAEVILPGIKKENITLIAGESIKITALREKKDGKGISSFMNYPYGEFEVTLPIYEHMDIEKLSIEFNHGILELTIPKT